jgi:hypothetical protein
MPLQATSGAASYDAFGGGVPVEPVYIEQIFQTWLYTGAGATQTITNGIDLTGKGGLTWIKSRSAATNNFLFDTNRGAQNEINSNNTEAQANLANSLVSFRSNGFTLGGAAGINANTATYASWTFRKQPKFFDVVTYTGNGTTFQTVNHNLGSTPGCIIVKQTNSGSTNWVVIHRDLAADTLRLNLTNAKTGLGGNALPSSTSIDFYGSGGSDPLNASGGTYVAYLFAHNAGGFGLTGTDNVISCGSFTTNGSGNASVTLGYEPQWIMTKCATDPGFGTNWSMLDIMRGWTASAGLGNVQANLIPNLSNAESNNNQFQPNATGFNVTGSFASSTLIYIAIRRGPMKVPTTGTSVFAPIAYTGNGSSLTQNAGITVDLAINSRRNTTTGHYFVDRLRGARLALGSQTSASETTSSSSQDLTSFAVQNGYSMGVNYFTNFNYAGPDIDWAFRRAPGFFDVVCYTGTGVTAAYNHNLGVAPELLILKKRNATWDWRVYVASLGNTNVLYLNDTAAVSGTSGWNNTTPTSTQFTVASGYNTTSDTFVAYLFASCPGVSKVGSYTGTGATQVINCGFTGGARFVLIKATSTTGDWYVWDSARGIVAGNDPYLELNTTDAEVTNTDWVDTAATGFELSNAGGNLANSNGVSYIFLAIS